MFNLTMFIALISNALFGCLDPTIYQNKHGRYYIPLDQNDRPAVRAIKTGAVYEEMTLNLIKEIYKPNTSVIHAGTYFGDMLPFFSKLVGDANRVWAFEPVKSNFICAMANIQLNNINNVILLNNALSSNKNCLPMRVMNEQGKLCGGSCKIIDLNNNLEKVEFVQSILLDETIPNDESISIIHLDVEGHELEALKGALGIIEKNHPILILEVWDNKKSEIDFLLDNLHYKEFKKVNGNRVYFYQGCD